MYLGQVPGRQPEVCCQGKPARHIDVYVIGVDESSPGLRRTADQPAEQTAQIQESRKLGHQVYDDRIKMASLPAAHLEAGIQAGADVKVQQRPKEHGQDQWHKIGEEAKQRVGVEPGGIVQVPVEAAKGHEQNQGAQQSVGSGPPAGKKKHAAHDKPLQGPQEQKRAEYLGKGHRAWQMYSYLPRCSISLSGRVGEKYLRAYARIVLSKIRYCLPPACVRLYAPGGSFLTVPRTAA